MKYPEDYFEVIKGKIELKYQKHFDLNRRLYEIVTSAVEEINKRKLRTTQIGIYEKIVLLKLAKNRKHFSAVQELCKLGFGEEAILIIRSMINAVIDLTYISKRGKEKLSKRFIMYRWIIERKRIQSRELLEKFGALQKLEGAELEEWGKNKIEALAKAKKFSETYSGRKSDWSGCSIEEKAQKTSTKAKKGMEILYQTIYRYSSDIEHSNTVALANYIKKDIPGEEHLESEPREAYIKDNLEYSFILLANIAEIFYKCFGLDSYNESTKAILPDFYDLYKINAYSLKKLGPHPKRAPGSSPDY